MGIYYHTEETTDFFLVFRNTCGHLTCFAQKHVGGPLLTCFEKGCPLCVSKEFESRARLRGLGSARVELQTHLAYHLQGMVYASIACCVVGLQGGP